METRIKDIFRFVRSSSSYNPIPNPPIRYVLKNRRNIFSRIDSLFCPTKILDQYDLFITERVLEYPFVFRSLKAVPGDYVLEFGCANSRLSIELASYGIKVLGIDLRPYWLTHPNFDFVQGDFIDLDISQDHFDAIIANSAIEHFGLGAYGEERRSDGSEMVLMNKFHQLLKKNGQLILSVPFGKRKVSSFYRVYDQELLGHLLLQFEVEDEEYYFRSRHSIWKPSSAQELSKIDWPIIGAGADGVALISARKRFA